MKHKIKQFFFLMNTAAKRDLPRMIGFFLLSSFMDVLGLGLIAGFLVAALKPSAIIQHIPSSLHPYVKFSNPLHFIETIGFCLIIAFIIKAIMGLYIQKRIARFTANMNYYLKKRLICKIQNVEYSYILKQNTGYLINRFSQVDSFTTGVVTGVLNFSTNFLIIFGIISFLLYIQPLTTILLIVTLAFIVYVQDFFFKNKLLSLGKSISVENARINKGLLHCISGFKEIRVLGKENYFLNRFEQSVLDYSNSIALRNVFVSMPRYVLESSASILIILVLLGGIWRGTSIIDFVPILATFAMAGMRLLPTLNQLVGAINAVRGSVYVMDATYELLCELQTLQDVCQPDNIELKKQLFTDIELCNLRVRYEGAKQDALNIRNLTIKKGQSVGLMGKSGAGKSTLVNTILGLVKPIQGAVMVDGKKIRNKRVWLNNFAYIPQSIFLLDDNLKRNIAMGLDDKEIDSDKLAKAISMAQLNELVKELSDGVETMIGENGVRLSGGQRQRVALARAFYHERDIIILDEATSSLDNETENEVIKAIESLHGIKTLIVIAHRLTTIEKCDVIYKLEQGRVIAPGSFDEVTVKTEAWLKDDAKLVQ